MKIFSKRGYEASFFRRKSHQMIRFSIFFCLFLVFCKLSAIEAYSQETPVTLNLDRVTVKEALKVIESNTEFIFFYNDNTIDMNRRVSIHVSQKSINEVLSQLLPDCTWQIENRKIILIPNALDSLQKGKRVSGFVMDESDAPLVGATVRMKNFPSGTITDVDGRFSLQVQEGEQLVISYIGYQTQELTVGNRSVVNIIMQENNQHLSEVVVTGYQTLSKERSAGSYGIIQGSDIREKAMLSGNILASMEGLATGLTVNSASGGDKFLIRGITSINSSRSPLFVVDGVPLMENLVEELINAGDIASITLLKDATAASIWGSQAANGVVVIITKRGTRNQKLNISYEGSFSYIGKPDYEYMNLMSGETFMKNAREVFDLYSKEYNYNTVKNTPSGIDWSIPIVYPHEEAMYRYVNNEISLAERDAILARLTAQNGRKSYEKNFMSNKLFTQHALNLNGGGDKHTYYFSLNYRGDQGNYKEKNDRITVNTYQDFQLTKWLKWDVSINASYGSKKEHMLPGMTSNSEFPYLVYENENGMLDMSAYNVYKNERERVEALTKSDMSFYPVADFNRSLSTGNNTNLRFNTGLTINLLKGLRYEGRFQYSNIHSKEERYWPSENWMVREERLKATPASTLIPVVPVSGGHFNLSNANSSDWTLRNQLAYDESFEDQKHQITALAGTEIRDYTAAGYASFLRGYDMQTMKYTSYDIYSLSQGISGAVYGDNRNYFSTNYYSQTETAKRYFSLYANGAYTYLRRYTLNASLRMDQSNLFGSDPSTQYKPIWSTGVAWKISDEPFLQKPAWMNDLTIRSSYGLAGNSPTPGQGGKYDILTASSNPSFETPGLAITSPANNKITWEKTRTVNLGFDSRLFDSRLSVSLDYYDKKTTDLLGLMMLNPITGWSTITGNLGTLTNKGFELSVNSHNIRNRDFNWFTGFTFSHNKNKVVELVVAAPYTASSLISSGEYVAGYPARSMFAYRYAGLDSNGRPQVYDLKGNIIPGNDSQSLTVDDVKYMGSSVPEYYGGLTNRFTYKSFDLSFLFVYNLEYKMRNSVNRFFSDRPEGNLHNDFDKRWRQPGDEAFTNIPKYSVSSDPYFRREVYTSADYNVLDASYVKLRNLSLGWQVDKRFCRKIYADAIKVTLQTANLFSIVANKENIDPEAYYSTFSYGSRENKYGPTYSVGLTINFK